MAGRSQATTARADARDRRAVSIGTRSADAKQKNVVVLGDKPGRCSLILIQRTARKLVDPVADPAMKMVVVPGAGAFI